MPVKPAGFAPVWGEATVIADDIIQLRASEKGLAAGLVYVDWEHPELTWGITTRRIESWGGEEDWRGAWLLFPQRGDYIHPCFYIRTQKGGYELGWCYGPEAKHQRIVAFLPGDGLQGDYARFHFSHDGEFMHISDRQYRGYYHTGPLEPTLGLYCEASEVVFMLEKPVVVTIAAKIDTSITPLVLTSHGRYGMGIARQ